MAKRNRSWRDKNAHWLVSSGARRAAGLPNRNRGAPEMTDNLWRAQRAALEAQDSRPIGAVLMGDPAPGRSALDQKPANSRDPLALPRV